MLSFEVSVIDIVLMLAVMVLLILQITKQSKKSVEPELSEPALSLPEEKGLEKPLEAVEPHEVVEPQKPVEEAHVQTGFQTSSIDCPHHFGYLKKLPADAPIPDECFGCHRMTDCFCK